MMRKVENTLIKYIQYTFLSVNHALVLHFVNILAFYLHMLRGQTDSDERNSVERDVMG